MRLIPTKIDVVTRTAPLPACEPAVSRLTADGLNGGCRLQAYVVFKPAGSGWTVHRYAYRLTGGPVRLRNAVNLRLVSDGAVGHLFHSPREVVNDGRWYVHDHDTDVARTALTYARFEAWFDVPGLAGLMLGDVRPSARPPRARRQDAR